MLERRVPSDTAYLCISMPSEGFEPKLEASPTTQTEPGVATIPAGVVANPFSGELSVCLKLPRPTEMSRSAVAIHAVFPMTAGPKTVDVVEASAVFEDSSGTARSIFGPALLT